MIIVCESSSLFHNMNTFARSDFLLPQMNDIVNDMPFGKHGKLRSHGACRNGLTKTDSQCVTRKKHSKEVEFERKSSQCHVQEQEVDRYKIMNLLHQVNASKKTVDNNDVIRHSEETTETKIFIMEKRNGTVPGRMVQMFWNQLRRLVGSAPNGSRNNSKSKKSSPKTAVTCSAEECGAGNQPNPAEEGFDKKPLEKIAFTAAGNVGGRQSPTENSIKKKRNFFKKLATKGKRIELSGDHESVFQPIKSVSDIVNDVQSKNRYLELVDTNNNGVFQLPQVQCNMQEQSASNLQPDQNSVKKFFIMRYISARKKPSLPAQS